MKTLSLKLKEDIFNEAEEMIKKIHISRNAYINEALSFYNKVNRRKLMREKLHRESGVVRATSLEILSEMEHLDDRLE
jgi:hypothetical protein